MPPAKKRQRTTAPTVQAARDSVSIVDVSPVQLALRGWVEKVHGLRHVGEGHTTPDQQVPGWKDVRPGTFRKIAQQVWSTSDRLFEGSLELLKKTGFLDESASLKDMLTSFVKLTVWPPEPGQFFKTSVLMWSMKDEAFWRGSFTAQSEIVDLTMSIGLSRFREAEVVSLRLPSGLDAAKHLDAQPGILQFDDGSQKTLGAFMCWLGLIAVSKDFNKEDFQHHSLQLLIKSLLNIATVFKEPTSFVGDPLDSLVARVVKQNSDAKVQPISSFQWAVLLQSLRASSDGDQPITLDEALKRYNEHPEVVAQGGKLTGFLSGSGSMVIDQKKSRAIRHWMEKTGPATWALVEASQHDQPFNLGPFGEAFAGTASMFVGSTVAGFSILDTELEPLQDEGYISLDWALPLSEAGQFILFQRVVTDFQKASALVDAASKKKYRKKDEELLQLRNRCALWGQVRDHVAAVSNESFEQKEKKLAATDFLDDDLEELLNRRPRCFALSMLRSEREGAQELVQRQEEQATIEVESQRLQVRNAKWVFFQKALAQDHLAMKQVDAAPGKLAMLQHKKDVQWRREQGELGRKAVVAYMDRYVRIVKVHQPGLVKPQLVDYVGYIANLHHVSAQEVHIVGFADFNIPKTRAKETCQELCAALAFINAMGASKNACLLEMPDIPRESAKRGLADEERSIQDNLWNQLQHCDCRYIINFDVPRWSAGRMVVQADALSENIFINHSELAVAGRPLGEQQVVLPRQRDLLLPESLLPDKDIRLSERAKPSPEQVRAQKGREKHSASLCSLLQLPAGKCFTGPVVLVNLTGYVEDMGAAVVDLKMKQDKIGSLPSEKLHYMSAHFLEEPEFGKARLMAELTDMWLDKKLNIAGLGFTSEPPKISQDEINKIPGALIATGSIDRLKLEVCSREGARIIIKPDEDKFWSSQTGTIAEDYAAIKADHVRDYENLLAKIVEPSGRGSGGETADAAGNDDKDVAGAAMKQFETLDALKAVDKIEEEAASEVADVSICRCESGKVFLYSKKDKTLPKYCQIGGFGTGCYVSVNDPQEGVKWNVTSDKVICQVDDATLRPDATSVSAMTLYKLLLTLEKTKRISNHKLSYIDVKRTDEAGGEEIDGFEVTVRNSQKYRPMKNPSGKEEKPSGKNIFARCVRSVEGSTHIQVAFRWRFEKVGGNLKVQKPYVITSHGIVLTKDKPVQATQVCQIAQVLSLDPVYVKLKRCSKPTCRDLGALRLRARRPAPREPRKVCLDLMHGGPFELVPSCDEPKFTPIFI
ncbi:unnamed protein product [Effrenium voratum]|nr:unnamed protein product [Effrenium voratum]